MTALMHYAEETVTLDRTRAYVQGRPMAYEKPNGFWVSVAGEDDWPSWCRSAHYARERLRVHHAVALMPDANVLRLEDPTQMLEFHTRWAVETEFERRHACSQDQSGWPIDWAAVTKVYDVVIIAPYQWSLRLDLSWYYTWDCASGCIWNLDAIESVWADETVRT